MRRFMVFAASAAFALAALAATLREAEFTLEGGVPAVYEGATVSIPSFDGEPAVIAIESRSISTTGVMTYSGRTALSPYRNATVTPVRGGFIASVKDHASGRNVTYRVKDGTVAVKETSPLKGGKCGTVSSCAKPQATGGRMLAAAALTGDPLKDGADIMRNGETVTNVIDILVAFDKSAGDWVRESSAFAGEENAVALFAADAIERVNSMYANTGLNELFTFNLAGFIEIGSDLSQERDGWGDVDSVKIVQDLNKCRGPYRDDYIRIHQAREAVCADIISLLVSNGGAMEGTFGVGYSLTDDTIRYGNMSEDAMDVCFIEAVALGNTLAHEIGHHMGAGHAEMAYGEESGPQLYDYSTGYYFEVTNAEGQVFMHVGTVMAYNSDGYEVEYGYGERWGLAPTYADDPFFWNQGLWTETPFFSSSRHTYKYLGNDGELVDSGVPLGDEKHDNTRIISLTYPLVANYCARKNTLAIVDPAGLAKSLSGGGAYPEGATATLKAAALPGGVFAGWYKGYDEAKGVFFDPLDTDGGIDYRTTTVKKTFLKDGTFENGVVFARFVESAEDANPVLSGEMEELYIVEGGVAIDPIQVAVESLSLPKVALAGLPAGLKFDAKTLKITGTPTKAGEFPVKATIKNVTNTKGAVGTFTIRVLDHELAIVKPDTATVKGAGRYIAGKKVTLGVTPTKGNVFGGWYMDGDFSVPATGDVDYRTASFPYVTTSSDIVFYPRVVTTAEDSNLTIDTEDSYTTAKDGSFELAVPVTSVSLPKLAVKGLPAGLKFDAKKNFISGKATKPGSYPCQISATNLSVKKAVTKPVTVIVPNFESEYLPNLDPAVDAYRITVGFAVDEALLDLTVKEGSGYTVTAVSGLPAGVKYNAKTGVFSGVPTKAGAFTVTVTAKNGKSTTVATVTVTVDPLPENAYGTYAGATPTNSLSVTISSVGKMSGKLIEGTSTWSFSAPSYSSDLECVMKSGKIVETNYFIVSEFPLMIGGRRFGATVLFSDLDGQGGISEEAPVRSIAIQNNWKLEPLKTTGKDMAKAPAFTFSPEEGAKFTVKVSSSGVATVKGTFVTGYDEKLKKDKTYSASVSVALIPVPDADGEISDVYNLMFYMPPKGVFGGFGGSWAFIWDGKAFSPKPNGE